LSNIDTSDGFYRIAIHSEDTPKLEIMFLTEDEEEQLIGLSLVSPMGWKQSPPLLTAATEMMAYLANSKLHRK
jgi:hypothetical protein